jgi:hypothetical protein
VKHLPAAEKLERMAIEDNSREVRAEAFRTLHAFASAGYAFGAFWDKTLADCCLLAKYYSRKANRWIEFGDTVALLAEEPWARDALLDAVARNHEIVTAASLLAGYWPHDERVAEAMRGVLFGPTQESPATNTFTYGTEEYWAETRRVARCEEAKTFAYGFLKHRVSEADYPAFLLEVAQKTQPAVLALDAFQQARLFQPPLEAVKTRVLRRCAEGDLAMLDAIGKLSAVDRSPVLLDRVLTESSDVAVRERAVFWLGAVPSPDAVRVVLQHLNAETGSAALARSFLDGHNRGTVHGKEGPGDKNVSGWRALCNSSCVAQVRNGVEELIRKAGDSQLKAEDARRFRQLGQSPDKGREGAKGKAQAKSGNEDDEP